MFIEAALPSGDVLPQKGRDEPAETAKDTTPSRMHDVRWEVVAFANGLAQAAIIQGRLEAEGIPARTHQEPAGVAFGLTVGILGQAEVLVPEPLVEEALQISNQSYQEPEIDEED
jgi:hypothetical protein